MAGAGDTDAEAVIGHGAACIGFGVRCHGAEGGGGRACRLAYGSRHGTGCRHGIARRRFGNGFYAATKRARDNASPGFQPTLSVATRDLGDHVEIRVRDNGTGIPKDVREKIFEPFFTTKPAGEGTGLGLSLSYDIVVKQHNGQLTLDSQLDSFTEFVVTLPRRMAAGEGGRA